MVYTMVTKVHSYNPSDVSKVAPTNENRPFATQA